MSGSAGWLLRRFLVLPLLLVLTAVFAVGWLAALILTVVSSPVIIAVTRRRPRARALRVATLAVAYLIVDCLCVLACFVLWLGAGFGWRLRTPRLVRAHRALLRAFLTTLVALADPARERPLDGIQVQPVRVSSRSIAGSRRSVPLSTTCTSRR